MLIDSYSREFKYLRLSLTEKCNFKCSYCLPNGYSGCGNSSYLNFFEIKNLARAFKALGIEKIRLTGGEPTLRSDLIDIISMLKNEIGIKQVALTTNGFKLEKMLSELKLAGLDALNVSLDSLDSEKFKFIRGSDRCESVKRAIDAAAQMSFKSIKINCVLLKDVNDIELTDFMEWVRSRPITFRFIELMRTGENRDYFLKHHISAQFVREHLVQMSWNPLGHSSTAGPAKEYAHPNSVGRMGFIAPYSKDFCATCNRLRVSAVGGLRLCLFGEGDMSIRSLLQSEDSQNLLENKICSALGMKTSGHRLHENLYGNMSSLSAIGG